MHVKDDIKSILLYGDYDRCKSPAITVVMPVYKRPELFVQSLKSVVNQKNAPDYEIVVVDNNDEGDLSPNLEVVRQINAPNVFYYRHEKNMGAGFSFNRGVWLARGKYISFCHDDDLFMEDTLSRLWDIHLNSNSEKCILSTPISIDMENNIIKDPTDGGFVQRHFPFKKLYEPSMYDYLFNHGGFHTASLFNREHFITIGGYKVEYDPSGDYGVNIAYTYYYGCLKNNIPTYYLRVGENDSKTAYLKFCEIDKFFREQVAEKLNLPSFVTMSIIKATYKANQITFRIKWGGESPSIRRELSLLDMIIVKLSRLPLFKNRTLRL